MNVKKRENNTETHIKQFNPELKKQQGPIKMSQNTNIKKNNIQQL